MSNSSILRIQNKKAVLVGINRYSDNGIRSLNYSVADVKSFFKIIADTDRSGYSPQEIKVLIDNSEKREEPSRSNIMSATISLANGANIEDSILFYFSGHGLEEGGKSYLLPSDSRVNILKDTAIPIEWIKDTLNKSAARVKIVILDACHSGPLIGKETTGIMTKGFHDSIFPPPEGFVVLSSCKLNEVSWEWPEKEQGVFSYFLVEGLKGEADKDKDGRITITEVNNYTSEKVKHWGFINSKQQSPTFECKISGDILLIQTRKVIEEAIHETIETDEILSHVKKILVLCVDIDDNLGTKTDIETPLVGREENLKAALALGLKAPRQSDANTLFEAIGIYDKLIVDSNTHMRDEECEISTIAGLKDAKTDDVKAWRKIVNELHTVLKGFPATEVIVVLNKSTDEIVMPLIMSRVPVMSVHILEVEFNKFTGLDMKQLSRAFFGIMRERGLTASRIRTATYIVLCSTVDILIFPFIGWWIVGVIFVEIVIRFGFRFVAWLRETLDNLLHGD